jgi:carbon storage regulator
MLVLSRRENQQIQIGENVLITVVRVSGDTVRIGVEAPREVSVMRTELLDSAGGRGLAQRSLHHSSPEAPRAAPRGKPLYSTA